MTLYNTYNNNLLKIINLFCFEGIHVNSHKQK